MSLEQIYIDILFFLTYHVFNSIQIYVCYHFMLTPRFKTRYVLPIFAAIHFTIYCLIYDTVPLVIRFLLQLLIIFPTALICFKDSVKKKLLAGGVVFAVLMLCDLIAAYISFDIFGFAATQVEVKTWDCVVEAMVINSVVSVILSLMIIIWRKFINHLEIKSMGLFILFPISQAISIVGYYYDGDLKRIAAGDPFDNPFTLIMFLLYVVTDIFMFLALRQNSTLVQTKIMLGEMENEMDMQMRYYENMNRQYTEIREYRHDIKNLIAAAEISMRSGATEDGMSLIGELKSRSEELKVPIYCGSAIVNAVLWDKQRLCREQGIDFSANIPAGEGVPLENTDACSLFANLLDNAIRAAEKTADPFVSISFRSEIGMFFLEVKNSSSEVFTADAPPKGKEDGIHHGCGMNIVRRIARKYNGSFSISSDGKTAQACFSAVIKE